MRRRLVLIGLMAAPGSAWAQQAILGGLLTQRDAARGVTEALGVAALRATEQLGRHNGFFADPAVHIPLPEQFAGVQRSLRPLGLSGPLDDLERSVNRAAEAAMPEAGRIFADVIRGLTISDAIAIVRGGEDAATRYLRANTEGRLTRLITPPMRRTLEASGAFRLMDMVAGQFSLRSLSRSLRGDVTDFSVRKALDGGFTYVAREERAIRRDPARRTSDILRRVFAG